MQFSASLLISFVLAAAALFPSAAQGIPQNFGQPSQGIFRADESIVVTPGDAVVLKFEVVDVKIALLKVLPLDTKETENIIRIDLKREGDTGTKLGPVSPNNDV